MIVYYKLNELLEKNNMKRADLQKELKIAPATIAHFAKNEYVALSVIDRICTYFKCQPNDIMEWVDEDEEKKLELQRQIDVLQAQQKKLEEQLKNM